GRFLGGAARASNRPTPRPTDRGRGRTVRGGLAFRPPSLLRTKLPSREQWRAFDAFRRHVVYLDIETTGFSIGRQAVTVVGVYDGRRKRSFVQGDNLEELPGALRQDMMLVKING